jgi:uncharacterized hydrophobic protein (TIGR00271 family)
MTVRRPQALIRLRLSRVLRAFRASLSRAFGVTQEVRNSIVARMLEGHARSAPIYWLQLCIALSLATLGLVLNGAAVVIGAMLVSPLMGPIVELGMGLAVGSPLLSIRSLVRTFWSIVVVVAGAAFITAVLPFREVTTEIAARTSPTALDLLVAVFCALAAALTVLRSTSDSTSAAAGTAIAIALVPPLCVVGFGVGTGDRSIALGAFLLFTANLCAILFVAALVFWLCGFNLVDTRHLEEARLGETTLDSHSLRLVKLAFQSRYGAWLRLAVPIAFVAAVWFPLTRALREVSWEVRARAHIQRVVQELPLARAAVRSSVSVANRTVHLRLVVVGKPSEARALETTLASRIAQVTVTPPAVEVVAVPDLETMEEVARTLARAQVSERRPQADLLGATADVAEALKQAWPASAGEIRRWRVDLTDREHPRLEIVHLGPPLGSSAQSLLGALLSERLGASLTVHEVAIPVQALTASAEDGAGWLPKLASAVEWARADRDLVACVTLPPPEDARSRGRKRRRQDAELAPIRSAALAQIADAPPGQVRWVPGPQWTVQLRKQACEPAPGAQ